ncbi:hypothetical protein [Phenylobacterium sp.]|uniref:hypothetical protein n=1 Tax=Phenylobacterium sp. TaxID=1871053 RepID=UPI003D2BB995
MIIPQVLMLNVSFHSGLIVACVMLAGTPPVTSSGPKSGPSWAQVLISEDKIPGNVFVFANRAENFLHQSGVLQIQHSAKVLEF